MSKNIKENNTNQFEEFTDESFSEFWAKNGDMLMEMGMIVALERVISNIVI